MAEVVNDGKGDEGTVQEQHRYENGVCYLQKYFLSGVAFQKKHHVRESENCSDNFGSQALILHSWTH